MSTSVPFLVRFAQSAPNDDAKTDSGDRAPEKGTMVTKVNRETTDDR